MVTRRRIRKAGGVYHVYNRGVLRKAIFHDDRDREHFLLLLEECAERYRVEFRSYCLMTNHIHLHFCTPAANISEAMHWLFTCFSCRFNAKYQRTGHVLETRFKSPLVQAGLTEVRLSRYIHRNPVEAGMVNQAAEYPWSSMQYYLRPGERPEWLHVNAILESIPSYLRFVTNSDPMDEQAHEIFAAESAVGSPDFLFRVAAEHGLQSRDILSTMEVLTAVSRTFGCSEQDLVAPKRCKGPARMVAAFLLATLTTLTSPEIGNTLGGRSTRSIHQYVSSTKRLMATDTEFRRCVERCSELGDIKTHLRSI